MAVTLLQSSQNHFIPLYTGASEKMAKFSDLRTSDGTEVHIEWDMTPDLAFCMFSAKGVRDELSNSEERLCYFFIDNYGNSPLLYLMERGNRFVNILAEIKAPLVMLSECVTRQGKTLNVKDNFPVDSILREWIVQEVMEVEECSVLFPVLPETERAEDMGRPLPQAGEAELVELLLLPAEPRQLEDEEVEQCVHKWNFADQILNRAGLFENSFIDSGDSLTVIDARTGLMWQRFGLDLCSIRNMKTQIEGLNQEGFCGYNDWRMPSLEEAMSLMEANENTKGFYLNPCFSKEQPFIFTSTKRKPTGYWFVDYKQGKVYWSSGTVPGGFCRLCRRAA